MKIKALIFFSAIFLSVVFSANAQTNENFPTFLNAHGIIQLNGTYYNTEGYLINVEGFYSDFDDKGINTVKQKLEIPGGLSYSVDSSFPNTRIYTVIASDLRSLSIYYLVKSADKKITAITFSTFSGRVPAIEKEFYNAVVTNTIPQYVYAPMAIDSISFAGRYIVLGPACKWMNVCSIQWPDNGQINWSEFSSKERAMKMCEMQKDQTSTRNMSQVLEEKEVDVIFEGQPVKATRLKLKVKIPKIIMGGSNVLVIYYVVAEVRGRYVACVLSHYANEAKGKNLPRLLSKIMELKE